MNISDGLYDIEGVIVDFFDPLITIGALKRDDDF